MKRSSYARSAPRFVVFLRGVLLTTAALGAAGAVGASCKAPPPAEAPSGSCSSAPEGDTLATTVSVTASTSDGRALSLRQVTSATSSPVGTTDQLTITLGGQPELSVSSTGAPGGATQVAIQYGEAFTGIKSATYASADGKTFTGTVDGRALAPFSAGADPSTIAFAGGGSLPTLTVDPVVQAAMQAAFAEAKQQAASCGAAPTSPARSPHPEKVYGVAGRLDDTDGTASCHTCIGIVVGGQVLCDIGAGLTCFFSGGSACALAVLQCVEEAVGGTAACHAPDSSCCPVPCGPTDLAGTVESCCFGGDTCLDPSAPGLCCGPGLQVCGGTTCCSADAPCRAGVGVCCPPLQETCGTGASAVCCDAGETCATNGVCCPADQVALDGSCCPVPTLNGECCPPGSFGEEACNGSCCTGTCCGDVCCPTGQACTTAGACCGMGQAACGSVCCATGTICADPSASQCTTPTQTVLEFFDGSTGMGTLGTNTCGGSPCDVEFWGTAFQLRGTGFAPGTPGTVTITIPSPTGPQTFTAMTDAAGSFTTTVTAMGAGAVNETITATETVNGTTYSASVLAGFESPPP